MPDKLTDVSRQEPDVDQEMALMTSIPFARVGDARFRAAVARLRIPGMGTEAVGPYLASLIHLVRPRRVLEVGRGYTTPFIASALLEVQECVAAEERELAGKTQPYLDDDCDLDQDWLIAEPPFALPAFYHLPYRPQFVTVDDLSIADSSADEVSEVLAELGLDASVAVVDAPLAECRPLLPTGYEQIDLAWVDAWECLYFIDQFWDLIDPAGGVVLMHYLMSYPEGEAILEYLRSIQQAQPGSMEIVNLLEPHKLAQNSVTMLRRTDGYRSGDYSRAGTQQVDLHAGLRADAAGLTSRYRSSR